MTGRSKENLPGGSLKYQFVYLKLRIQNIFRYSYCRLTHGDFGIHNFKNTPKNNTHIIYYMYIYITVIHISYHILYVCMYNILYTIYYILYTKYYMLYAICYMLYTIYQILDTRYYILYTILYPIHTYIYNKFYH